MSSTHDYLIQFLKIVKNLTIIVFVPMLLNACSQQFWREVEEQGRINEQKRIANLQNICDVYGFKRGTTAYSQCLQKAERDLKDAKDKANQESDERWRRTQCYASGRMDC
jgi:hypothetical protein